jgi:hypothetical protein
MGQAVPGGVGATVQDRSCSVRSAEVNWRRSAARGPSPPVMASCWRHAKDGPSASFGRRVELRRRMAADLDAERGARRSFCRSMSGRSAASWRALTATLSLRRMRSFGSCGHDGDARPAAARRAAGRPQANSDRLAEVAASPDARVAIASLNCGSRNEDSGVNAAVADSVWRQGTDRGPQPHPIWVAPNSAARFTKSERRASFCSM